MKRRKVYNIPGHAHELTFSCYRRWPLLARDRTRRWAIEALDTMRHKHDVALLAYVIMPEHMHLLVYPRTPEVRIEQAQRTLKQSVARRALRWLREHEPDFLKHLAGESAGPRQRHHFWQAGGGYDRDITDPATLDRAIAYIHANPVRRGLVSRPTDWPWSSACFWAQHSDAMLVMDTMPSRTANAHGHSH